LLIDFTDKAGDERVALISIQFFSVEIEVDQSGEED
jgi:hypothetical protein